MKKCCDNHAPAESLATLTNKLRRGSRKITGPRQAILDVLRRHRHPLTIKEVFAGLTDGDCDLVTVYRSMRVLEGLGMVKRFDFGDGMARFELLEEGDDGHHHHLVCVQCNDVREIEECFANEWQERIAARNGFRAITHKLEFFGLCPDCQRSK